MADKNSLESQVKNLEKGMGTIVKAFKDLKATVKALEEKVQKDVKALEEKVEGAQNHEVREIIKSQKMLEELISANSNNIKSIDQEIKKLQSEKF